MCGDTGVKRERRWGSPRLPPSWGKGRRDWTSKGGQANFPPTRPGGLCQDRPHHSQDNGVSCSLSGQQESLPSRGAASYMTKGGTYKGGQAAPHYSRAFVLPPPLPLKRLDQRGLPGGRRFTGSGAKQQPPSQLLLLSPPPGSRVQEGPWDGKVGSHPSANLTKATLFPSR